MIKILENLLLKEYTTLQIGGSAKYFVEVHSIEELKEALHYAKDNGLKFYRNVRQLLLILLFFLVCIPQILRIF